MPAIDSARLMLELRSLAAEAQRSPALSVGAPTADTPTGGAADFGAMLRDSINPVNSMQQSSAELGAQLEQGVPGIDITRVMVEAQKATLAFRAMTEVRNRLVSAYQEVMNMTI